ncbi:Serine/threonine-protein kinase-like protein [Hapsidospora chrysogenum ATCC 11550]|uniref:Serine/threonine-protein kinase-like protein n=1 Tax=Hapsidospora chrysogenum (strain ATCC 11550 / CBS 779.69 / DSM 880 / IAM 14645 / JCM 23072 / IMI 49137) TaxID=857340 RepID=A0A086SW43_HAPC1|nr:Serine/threonine-protein kinase-like protein [Hapsidospora chrysogenum ATCC 11550]
MSHPSASHTDPSNPQHDYSPDTVADRPQGPPSNPQAIQFQSNTIAASPPPPPPPPRNHSAPSETVVSPSPALRISTDLVSSIPNNPQRRGSLDRKTSSSNLQVARTPSIKAALGQALGGTATSAASSLAGSPVIAAMGDMTPLPSPLLSADSPGPWKKLISGTTPPSKPRERLGSVGEDSVLGSSLPDSTLDPSSAAAAISRRKYPTLDTQEHPAPPPLSAHDQQPQHHTRNRSASEYIPDPLAIPKRHITVSGSRAKAEPAKAQEPHIRREINLAEQRGLTPTVTKPPTPPPSESSRDSADGTSGRSKDQRIELYEAHDRRDGKKRRWRALRSLGQGTFSQVMLATSQIVPGDDESAESPPERKTLVAVKICEHGPRGGASEDRVEMSLKRELEILQDIHHPSLVDLKAFSIEPTRAILVLTYSPGGDLFDVATAHRALLTPPLLRRVFAELVGAVRYLHDKRIVHRDIKLENVLVNLTPSELADPTINWTTYPNSITTLADLGLSRRINPEEKLETRCGSDDYAAPEVIMGQPYDGRATDAWSLGVLLYALLEARLPFDPHPGMSDAHRMRSRTSHRIARVEWRWVEYAGDDGDHEGSVARFEEKGLAGAMRVTEGLLKRARSRWTMDRVASEPWVAGAIALEGGLKFWEEQEGQEVPSETNSASTTR